MDDAEQLDGLIRAYSSSSALLLVASQRSLPSTTQTRAHILDLLTRTRTSTSTSTSTSSADSQPSIA